MSCRPCASMAIVFDLVNKVMNQCNNRMKLWTTGYIINIYELYTNIRFSFHYLKHRYGKS